MITRPFAPRFTRIYLRRRTFVSTSKCRSLASTAGTSFRTEVISGVRIATRNTPGRTTRLALCAKAGTRYEPLPGLTAGMVEYAFKNTTKRSSLRITRESELLGSKLSAQHTRETLFLMAGFMREDIPYFMELLAEIAAHTRYSTHELHEDVERVVDFKQARFSASPPDLALDLAHSAAFHSGLGAPIYPATGRSFSRHVNEETLASYASSVFAKSNIALVCDGAESQQAAQWTEQFWGEDGESYSGNTTTSKSTTVYHGGERRLDHLRGNAMVIAFPGSPFGSIKPELLVLAALLGGQTSVKWGTASAILSKVASSSKATLSATHLPYSDAGLLAIQINGSASGVAKAAKESIQGLQSLSQGYLGDNGLPRAIAQAKFDLLDGHDSREGSILTTGAAILHGQSDNNTDELIRTIEGVTTDGIKKAALALLNSRASVSAVGDTFFLPYAADLGLKV